METSSHQSTCHCICVDLQLDTYIVVIILIKQIKKVLISKANNKVQMRYTPTDWYNIGLAVSTNPGVQLSLLCM